MRTIDIKPFEELDLKIYAYILPEVPTHQGYVKIGETNRVVEQRIREQLGTAGIKHKTLFEKRARRSDGTWFHDRDLHRYLIENKIKREIFNDTANEWFYFNGHLERAEELTDEYINRDYDEIQISKDHSDYILRFEQEKAVSETYKYYMENKKYDDEEVNKFLWNAKPRFGKTLSTYDFIRKIEAKNVLIVTNRPAIANSWYEDFHKFIGWKKPYLRFVSETDSLRGKAITRAEFLDHYSTLEDTFGQIVFISLQDLKGAKFAGGDYDKLQWVPDINWDLLVIDEAHEGVDTDKTERAFLKINRKFTLHLSGTPFKALANNNFSQDQIYNWSYLDEQKTKIQWNYQWGTNPYESLPTLNLFTYQMSSIIEERISKGLTIEDDVNLDYAFDLNEFFKTKENGDFEYESSVIAFLDNLCTGKFPFSKEEYKKELNHTFWLLPWVASAKAMEKLLNRHPVFKEYKTVLAAGDGLSIASEDVEGDEYNINVEDFVANEKSYDKVKNAINKYEKTITLSVGQLTTGVTIPEWTAVLMLNNIKSPSQYFQAAFRAQNPYEYVEGEKLYRKENSYIFDFAPERTLQLYDKFANNLNSAEEPHRENNIKELLNFFPVIGEDEEGTMKELDAEEVLAIPQFIRAKEVVKRGFMSNLLFSNISGIFRAPKIVSEILNKLRPEENKKFGDRRDVEIEEPMLNDKNQVEIPREIVINTTKNLFGEKIYKTVDIPDAHRIGEIFDGELPAEKKEEKKEELITRTAQDIAKNITENLKPGLENLRQEFTFAKSQGKAIEREIKRELENKVEVETKNYVQEIENLQKEKSAKIFEITKDISEENFDEEIKQQVADVETDFHAKVEKTEEKFQSQVTKTTEEVAEKVVEKQIEKVETKKKDKTESDVRDHLRGFARTTPSFLMAYGTESTTLDNFEKNIDPDVFLEITGITIEEFRKLRDGFDYIDDEGRNRKFNGLFDETVFNASIKEFFKKKIELANYFDETLEEDIFDYIPPQETNQIYTPRKVVKMMVDKLEEENPEIFKSYNAKFGDLYSKSGLYLTEIVKRLNKGLEGQIPDRDERIKHILENQVYGVCPTKIIYNIVKNYVYGNFKGINTENIVMQDLSVSADNNTMEEDLKKAYGGKNLKFDIIIGNPPYQEEIKGTSDRQIYPDFMDGCFEISEKVLLITPARFLFNAGKTSKAWNRKMLNDPHIKVVYYEQDSSRVFPGTDIKGGVVVTYRDNKENFGAIKTFVVFDELNSILKKVRNKNFATFNSLIYSPESYRLSEKLHLENPTAKEKLSKGHDYDLTTNIFDRLDELFYDKMPDDGEKYIKIYGRQKNQRLYKWFKMGYVDEHDNLLKYKVFVPKSNGSGAIGEVLSTPLIGEPLIGEPLIGHTQTYISIGAFSTRYEAEAVLKYVKTKFARTMLGTLKVTQDNKKDTWSNVPMQDFTENSDIDWSKSVAEIDRQLYKKYNLSQEEINFIEEKVKPME